MFPLKRLALLLIAVSALAVAGCGSSGDDSGTESTSGSGGGTFPVEVTHEFGTTEVPSQPERIVTVGITEQDAVLALGDKPIATTEWYGEQPGAIWPWAKDALGDAPLPTVLNAADGIPFEEVAKLQPDLIIGTSAGMSQGDYDKLKQIAPTVAGVAGGGSEYFAPWDEQTQLIADSLGKSEQGKKLIAGIKDDYAKVAAENPEFEGKTATYSQGGFYDGLIYVYPPGLDTDFLTYLGFEINPNLEPLVEKQGEQVTVSAERVDVLDADVIVFATDEPNAVPALKKVPTFDTIPAVAENRAVYTDPTLAGAIYFNTALSLPYVLEHLTPQLQKAIVGKAPQKQGTAPPGDELQ